MAQTQIHLELDAQAHPENSPQSSPQASPETRFPTYPPKRARYRTWAERRGISKNRKRARKERKELKKRIEHLQRCLDTTGDEFPDGLPLIPQVPQNGLPLIPEVPQNGLPLIQNGLPLLPEVFHNDIYEETACQQTVPNEVAVDWDSIYKECHATLAEERVAWDWAGEWDDTPEDLAPSRPLSLLLEPAPINQITHARKAKRASLNYYDASNEPRGSMLQRRMDDELRKEFMWAEAIGRTIDLTGED